MTEQGKSGRRSFMIGAGSFVVGAAVGVLGGAASGLSLPVFRQRGLTYQWDIRGPHDIERMEKLEVTAGPGSGLAEANDGSRIKLTGSGTFVEGDEDDVTGGGTWETFDPDGNTTGSGSYAVTKLVHWELGPGYTPNPVPAGGVMFTVVDNFIVGGKPGNVADLRAGLAHLKVEYDDGSRGVLEVSCRQWVESPNTIVEGTSISKGFVAYASIAFELDPETGQPQEQYTAIHLVR